MQFHSVSPQCFLSDLRASVVNPFFGNPHRAGIPATATVIAGDCSNGANMAKPGKKYRAAAAKIEDRPYELKDALTIVKDTAYAKFDETVEVHMRLGVDPRHADQMVRGTIVLPHGT